jgi:hypothetical protein
LVNSDLAFDSGSFLRKEDAAEASPPEVITDMSQIHSIGTLTQVRRDTPAS